MRGSICVVVLASLLCAGCGPLVDLTKGLQVLDVSTGWSDLGIVDGQNKLVPSITFKLKNVSDQSLVALQINAVFRKAGTTDEWGSGYLIISQSEGLAPGVTTKPWTIRSTLGHTSLEPRMDMLKDARFVDAKVDVFAKYASAQWKRVADYPIERQLLAQ
jgi:hypothetical protein